MEVKLEKLKYAPGKKRHEGQRQQDRIHVCVRERYKWNGEATIKEQK